MSKVKYFKMKKVIGYVRVSSLMQNEDGKSIDMQIDYIKKYCKGNNYELVDIFEDRGISGMKSNRDGLNNLISAIEKKECECVVVYSLSRLGRKLKNIVDWIDLLNKKDIEFISIKENFNVNEIYGKLMLNIMGSLNEFEVNIISERIKDVKRNLKSKNEVYCGDILYGMYRRGNKLIKNNNEIKVLRLIKKYRNEGISYFKISDKLNSNGIKSKNKGKWYGSSVRGVYLNGVIEKYNL